MKEQNANLPDFLIADMYKNSLVEIESKIKDMQIVNENVNFLSKNLENIKLLGNNTKNIIVVTNQTDSAFLPENELIFLGNILIACNLNLTDIGIANFASKGFNYLSLKNELDANKIILLGLPASSIQLPFTVPDFQVQNYDGCAILQTPPLSAMNEATEISKNLKKKLWTALKLLFEL